MAIPRLDRRPSSDADVQNLDHRKDSFGADGESIAEDRDDGPEGEQARFLPMDISPDSVPEEPIQRYVVLMCVQFLFIIEFSQFIMEPPLQEIMEDFVCHSYHPDHAMGVPQEQDARCKDADVQGTLAMARSWMLWVEMLVRRYPVKPSVLGMIANSKYCSFARANSVWCQRRQVRAPPRPVSGTFRHCTLDNMVHDRLYARSLPHYYSSMMH